MNRRIQIGRALEALAKTLVVYAVLMLAAELVSKYVYPPTYIAAAIGVALFILPEIYKRTK